MDFFFPSNCMLGITVSASPQWMMEKNSHTEIKSYSLLVMKMRNWKNAMNFPLFLPPKNEIKELYKVH